MLIIRANKKTLLLTFLSVAALGSGGLFAYNRYAANDKSSDSSTSTEVSPPTEEEKSAGDRQKETIVEQEKRQQESQNQATDGQMKTATVIITDAGQYDDIIEVRSFIPDHYQDGTCTITFRKNTQVITKDTPAYKDVSTTICTNPLIKRSEFPSAGDWQVSVSYNSKDATGKSETQTVNIK